MSKAAVILGPSNSGTRYLTRLFLKNGYWGDPADHTNGFTQRLDDGVWPAKQRNLVWKTHNPNYWVAPEGKNYGNKSVHSIVASCLARQDEVIVILVYRDVRLNAKAKVTAGYAGTQDEFWYDLVDWYADGFRSLKSITDTAGCSTYVVNYDLMVKHPKLYTNEINNHLGLSLVSIPTFDANAKHWDVYP